MKKIVLIIISAMILSACIDEPEAPVTFEQQFNADKATIRKYLSDNGIDAELHPSGLSYLITQEGTGSNATFDANVTVGYEGRFLSNGQVFDSSPSVTFDLNRLIEGWQIGIPLVKEGGSITLYIPSGMAYGTNPPSGIPANANMIFDIELISIN